MAPAATLGSVVSWDAIDRSRRVQVREGGRDEYTSPMASIDVALVQCNPAVGALEDNARMVDERRVDAVARGADLVVFPELVITGYPPEDLLYQDAFLAAVWEKAMWIVGRTTGELCIFGVPRRVDHGEYLDGRSASGGVTNSVVIARSGRVLAVYDKVALPNYGVFDERRWFVSGTTPPPVITHRGVTISVLICEDAWIDPSPGEPHSSLAEGASVLPIADASVNSPVPDLVCVVNGSPYRVGKVKRRREVMERLAERFDRAVAAVNLVGGQDELVFDGSSLLISRPDQTGLTATHDRAALKASVDFVAEPFVDLTIHTVFNAETGTWSDVDAVDRDPGIAGPGAELGGFALILGPHRRAGARSGSVITGAEARRPAAPDSAPENEPEGELYRALVVATRDYVLKSGFATAWIALSGGIDSALTAAIAVDALGAANVRGVMMPSRYSSDHSVGDARLLADNLGIRNDLVPIDLPHRAMESSLEDVWGSGGAGLAGENVQARLRGVIIMALSNSHGGLVLTTGNKSEMAVGYCTLYGDMAGAFAVIKDVLKTEVYQLCRWRNRYAGFEVIPEHVLTKPPSAELRPDQTDQDSLPPYEVLDSIIRAYLERDASPDLIATRTGHDRALVTRVVGMIDRAEFKRRQAAPGVKISRRAFGRDHRMPIVNQWRH